MPETRPTPSTTPTTTPITTPGPKPGPGPRPLMPDEICPQQKRDHTAPEVVP